MSGQPDDAPRLSRRTFLALGAAAVAAGCSSGGDDGAGTSAPSTARDGTEPRPPRRTSS